MIFKAFREKWGNVISVERVAISCILYYAALCRQFLSGACMQTEVTMFNAGLKISRGRAIHVFGIQAFAWEMSLKGL